MPCFPPSKIEPLAVAIVEEVSKHIRGESWCLKKPEAVAAVKNILLHPQQVDSLKRMGTLLDGWQGENKAAGK